MTAPRSILRIATLAAVPMVLSGCSDLIEGIAKQALAPRPEPPIPATPNFALDSASGSGTKALAGTGVQTNSSSGATTIVTATGSVTAPTRAIILADGTVTLNDSNGFDVESKLVDGTAVLSAYSGTRFKNMSPYEAIYEVGGVVYNVEGVFGVVSDAAAVSTVSGSATYRGQSYGALVRPGGTTKLIGTSSVTADFDAGTVTAATEEIVGYDSASGAQFTTPVTSMKGTALTINGNTFTGLDVTINGTAASSVTGANTTIAASGHFYGAVEASPTQGTIPLEVGGVLLAQGDDGKVYTVFVSRAD